MRLFVVLVPPRFEIKPKRVIFGSGSRFGIGFESVEEMKDLV